MSFLKAGKKRTRSGGLIHRESLEQKGPRLFSVSAEGFMLLSIFLILTAAITEPPKFPSKTIGYDIESQAVALEEIRSDRYFETEDLKATAERRDAAALQTPDSYRIDHERVSRQLHALDERVEAVMAKREEVAEAVRNALLDSNSNQTDLDVVMKAVSDYSASLKNDSAFHDVDNTALLSPWFMPTLDSVPKRQFGVSGKKDGGEHGAAHVERLLEPEGAAFEYVYARQLAQFAHDGLEYILSYGVGGPESTAGSEKRGITITRETPIGDQKRAEDMPSERVPRQRDAELMLTERIEKSSHDALSLDATSPFDWTRLQAAATAMAKPDIAPTLEFDKVETERARERARLAVAPVTKEIRPGKVLQRSGDDWTAQSRSDVRTYWTKLEEQREPLSRTFRALAANMLFAGMALACLVRSVRFLTPRPQDLVRNLNLSLLIMTAMVTLGRIISYFDPSGVVVPTAAGAILLTILLNPRIAVIASMMTSILISIQYGYDWRVLTLGFAMSVAGTFSTYQVRKRSDITNAALKATLAGIFLMAALVLGTETQSENVLRKIFMVVLNGGVCMFIVPGLLSPLERLFRITTDIQLLEYSDLNNELLSKMAIEMPATYAHSLMLGQIAEAAAEAVGANGLLARVCAYYHDIGKMRRPEYFCENQNGVNVHDDMPPRLSARAIAAHVTFGVEIAREYRLPKPIIDGIREHHGTCMISFFYQQALEQHRHHDVQEQDFRYPGPKPQSRETAILMICDAVESGVRSIKNPNEERIREFFEKIVAARSSDRQFDECGLTMKELDTIKDVVARLLVTSLHARIAYPDAKHDRPTDNVIPMTGAAR
jgi:putative nucleotidyltransferase with HDIG domain